MATTTSQIEIRINKDVENIIRAKQMDSNSRFLQITLLQDDGTAYDLTGHTARFNARKQDLTHVFNDCEMTDPANGIITVELTDQTLAIGGGKVIADIGVYNSDGKEILTTRTFEIEVQTTIRDDSAIESSDEYGAVVTLFQDVWDIRDRIVRIDELLGNLDDDIPEGGDQASTVSFMGAVNRSYNMMLSQGIIGLDVVIYAQTVLQNVNSASAAWAFEIANRQGKLGMLIDTILNLGDVDLQEMTTWAEVLTDATTFEKIVNDDALISAVVESGSAMTAIIDNDTALATLTGSETAMTAIAENETSMTTMATSAKALNAVVKSSVSSIFVRSSYFSGMYSAMLTACADTNYFTRITVVASNTRLGSAWRWHDAASNAWTSAAGSTASDQNAIYFMKTTQITAGTQYLTTIRSTDKSGGYVELVTDNADTSIAAQNLCLINNFNAYNIYMPAWTASADSTAGEAFMAI